MSEIPHRRNPLRLVVSRETQLRILWLVGGGILVSMASALLIAAWVEEWIWAIALALAVGAFVSLLVSRRIAGPFYRIERDLEALLAGAPDGHPIRLRPGDPLQHLAALVNALIERTQTRT